MTDADAAATSRAAGAPSARPELPRVAAGFRIPGRYRDARRHGQGHIHETWLARFDDGGGCTRWLLQRLNTAVFRAPERVMENLERVCAHLERRLAAEGVPDVARRSLRLVPARDGGSAVRDAAGGWWRAFHFIEGTESLEVARGPDDARAAAEAFGRFQARLADLPPPRLHETIPGFHDARRRFEALLRASRTDPLGRAAGCSEELAWALAREAWVDLLAEAAARGELPERVTHNDTKLDNLLFDRRSGEALCVIDLDTVMPGLSAFDFGDLVRTTVSEAAEDEPDLARIRVRPERMEAVAEGWLRGTGGLLEPAERDVLVLAGMVMTFVVGLRFLADHLEGDRYFRVARPGHNLQRARAQLRLAGELERARASLEARVARLTRPG